MFDPHDLARTLCRYSSNESVFRGVGPQFWGAAHGNGLSNNYMAHDTTVMSPSLDKKFE